MATGRAAAPGLPALRAVHFGSSTMNSCASSPSSSHSIACDERPCVPPSSDGASSTSGERAFRSSMVTARRDSSSAECELEELRGAWGCCCCCCSGDKYAALDRRVTPAFVRLEHGQHRIAASNRDSVCCREAFLVHRMHRHREVLQRAHLPVVGRDVACTRTSPAPATKKAATAMAP